MPGCPPTGERAPGTHYIRGWFGSRAEQDAVDTKRISYSCCKSNSGRPASSQSLYQLSYPDSQGVCVVKMNCVYKCRTKCSFRSSSQNFSYLFPSLCFYSNSDFNQTLNMLNNCSRTPQHNIVYTIIEFLDIIHHPIFIS
jgi:hypothetical protein